MTAPLYPSSVSSKSKGVYTSGLAVLTRKPSATRGFFRAGAEFSEGGVSTFDEGQNTTATETGPMEEVMPAKKPATSSTSTTPRTAPPATNKPLATIAKLPALSLTTMGLLGGGVLAFGMGVWAFMRFGLGGKRRRA